MENDSAMEISCFSLLQSSPSLLESLSDSQLEEVAIDFRFPDPVPEPLPIGMSKLDGLDRKTLLGIWEEEEQAISRIMRELKGRNEGTQVLLASRALAGT